MFEAETLSSETVDSVETAVLVSSVPPQAHRLTAIVSVSKRLNHFFFIILLLSNLFSIVNCILLYDKRICKIFSNFYLPFPAQNS